MPSMTMMTMIMDDCEYYDECDPYDDYGIMDGYECDCSYYGQECCNDKFSIMSLLFNSPGYDCEFT